MFRANLERADFFADFAGDHALAQWLTTDSLGTMPVEKLLTAAKTLPFDERVELAHRLWDEFMDGFQDWKAPPVPKGKFPWKTLKAEIDAALNRTDRLELAQQVWSNVVENGYDPSNKTPHILIV